MARKRFRTPPTLPEDTQCRGTVVPASKEWLGLYSDALLELTYAHNYEQVEPTDLTPDETASLAYQQYLAWLDSTCGGGDCSLPGFDPPVRTYRRNPTTGRIEWQNNGEWEEPTGDYAIPDPEPREEPTEAEKKCGAASNAANVLRELYSNILSVYDAEVDPLLNQIDIAGQVAVAIGSMFGPVSASFLALSGFAWEVFTQALTVITEDDWSNAWQEELVCILNSASTVGEDGEVTFDFFTVNSNLVGFLLPVVDDYVRVRWQVWYLLQMIGEQGLNVAGGTTAVEGDCVTCDTWCYTAVANTFNPTLTRGYVTAQGYLHATQRNWWDRLAEGSFVVNTEQCQITRVAITGKANGATGGGMWANATPASGALTAYAYNAGGFFTGFPQTVVSVDDAAIHSTGDTTTVSFYLVTESGGGERNGEITAFTLYGTGVNPFAVGSNC